MPDTPEAAGHAGPTPLASATWDGTLEADTPEFNRTEIEQLRMRIIALESLVMSLFAAGSNRQHDLAREMSMYIAPRPGFTPHALTLRAGKHMNNLLERASTIRDEMPSTKPYRRTRIFDEGTLPASLRREHRTKPGIWAVIRILDGRVRFRIKEPESVAILEPGRPGLVQPEQPHVVEPLGPVRLRLEFYRQQPEL